MTVTEIIELDKKRSKIYIDEQFAFVLYKGELRLYHIAEGKTITQEDYEQITHVLLPKRAKLRAMNLLKAREYTKKQLRDKLYDGGYPEDIIEEAVAYVESYHYIDDTRYARQYAQYRIESKSRRCIELELIKRGVDKQIINNVFTELEEEGIGSDETAMIERLLQKRRYDKENATMQEKQKTYAFLMRRGFSSESIQKMIFS